MNGRRLGGTAVVLNWRSDSSPPSDHVKRPPNDVRLPVTASRRRFNPANVGESNVDRRPHSSFRKSAPSAHLYFGLCSRGVDMVAVSLRFWSSHRTMAPAFNAEPLALK